MSTIPDGYREAICYLQIEARGSGPYGGRHPGPYQATATRLTVDKPSKPIPGAVVVKVRIQVPKAAFEPLQPEAVVRVPEDLVQRPLLVLTGIPALAWGICWANRTTPRAIPVARTEVTDPRALALTRPRLTVIRGGRDEQVYDWEASGT